MRRLSKFLFFATLIASTATAAQAAQVPGWLRLLHWISGESSATDVPIGMMGPHMQMTVTQPKRPGDRERAASIVAAARDTLRRYPDVASAERDGYKAFPSSGKLGEEVHYTSIGYGYAEGKRIDYSHPGSILFQRTARGLVPVGVMYSAPARSGAAELDSRAPLSVAPWHRHVDFCWAVGSDPDPRNDGPEFGYSGSIHDEATCRARGGYYLPLAFGWMTHVYPGRRDPWGGESMQPGQSGGRMSGAHEHPM